MKQENETKITVPCTKCFETCTLGEFEILDGSSVCENCFEIDFKNNRSQYMGDIKPTEPSQEYQDYLDSPLDPRD